MSQDFVTAIEWYERAADQGLSEAQSSLGLMYLQGLGVRALALRLREDLRQAMVADGIRIVDVWTARFKLVRVTFPPVETPAGPLDPFFNANRPEDLAEAERFARA